MEKKKNLLGIIVLLLLVGCTATKIQDKNIVLIESEIPWKMSIGEYVSYDGTVYTVTEKNPRWSVSEAWMFESFSYENKNSRVFLSFTLMIFTTLIIILIVNLKYK